MQHATRVHIMGATGYTGQELVRILSRHPMAELISVTSESTHNAKMSDVTRLRSALVTCTLAEASARAQAGDVAFLCLPHGASREAAETLLRKSVRVIDLGSDFRSAPLESSAQGSGAVPVRYGLCEVEPYSTGTAPPAATAAAAGQAPTTQLVANPGCYPTSALLPLIPLLRGGLIAHDPIFIDSKSGISGAGRQAKTDLLMAEQHSNFSAYAPGRAHRHVPEIDGYLGFYAGVRTQVVFTPHLLPLSRGILSTMYTRAARASLHQSDVLESWHSAYKNRPFVWIFDDGLPQLSHVVGTNRIAMGCTVTGDTLIIVAVIDNLLKGAAGQAVQNFNRLLGLPETAGLENLI